MVGAQEKEDVEKEWGQQGRVSLPAGRRLGGRAAARGMKACAGEEGRGVAVKSRRERAFFVGRGGGAKGLGRRTSQIEGLANDGRGLRGRGQRKGGAGRGRQQCVWGGGGRQNNNTTGGGKKARSKLQWGGEGNTWRTRSHEARGWQSPKRWVGRADDRRALLVFWPKKAGRKEELCPGLDEKTATGGKARGRCNSKHDGRGVWLAVMCWSCLCDVYGCQRGLVVR